MGWQESLTAAGRYKGLAGLATCHSVASESETFVVLCLKSETAPGWSLPAKKKPHAPCAPVERSSKTERVIMFNHGRR